MDEFYQIFGLWAAATFIHYAVDKMTTSKKDEINKKSFFYPSYTPKTIQTCTWRYSDLPKSLLFDFSKTSQLKKIDDIKAVIKYNIPPIYNMDFIEKSNTLIELHIEKGENESLTNQLISILKHKGLFIKKENLWLKPTLTISRQLQNHFLYWKVALWEFPIEEYQKESEHKLKIRLIHLLNKTFKNLYKERKEDNDVGLFIEGDLFFIDIRYIHFETNHGKISVHLLVQELKTNGASVINPSRQLIYVPFLHQYLPVQFVLLS